MNQSAVQFSKQYKMNKNTENSFLNLLNTEKDILLRILSELSESEIKSLGETCLAIHDMFYESGVWQDLIDRCCLRAKLGHNCYDWKRRLGTTYEFEVLDKLEMLTSR